MVLIFVFIKNPSFFSNISLFFAYELSKASRFFSSCSSAISFSRRLKSFSISKTSAKTLVISSIMVVVITSQPVWRKNPMRVSFAVWHEPSKLVPPEMILSKVVFPHPFLPIMPIRSPSFTEKVISFKISSVPKLFETLFNCKIIF